MKKLSPEKQARFIEEARPVLASVHADMCKIIEAGDMVQACAFILSVEGDPKFVNLQAMIDEDKDSAASFLRRIQSLPGVLATLFVSETWMSQYSKEEFEAAGGKENLIPPSQHPNRIEAVVFILETPVGALFSEARITRDPDKLGPLTIHADSLNEPPPEGRFTGGFQDPVSRYKEASNLNSISSYVKSQGTWKL
jgi:hypothetical protein